MEDSTLPNVLGNPLKRAYMFKDITDVAQSEHSTRQSIEESESSMPTPPNTTSPSDKGTERQDHIMRDPSPALSDSTILSSAPPSTAGDTIKVAQGSSATPTGPPRKKRRTLNPAEKEEQRKAKLARAQEREEKKAKKDQEEAAKEEERRLKTEERRIKNEEREAKQRERDLKKQAKEMEKQQKEEEEAKKQRSQLRLTSLFAKPQTPKAKQSTDMSAEKTPSESKPLETYDQIISGQEGTGSPLKTSQTPSSNPKPTSSDYEKYFLKFEPPSHSRVAQDINTTRDTTAVERSQQSFDEIMQQAATSKDEDRPQSLLSFFAESKPRARGIYQPRVREIIESLQGSSMNPVDLTNENGDVERYRPQDLLGAVVMRHLHFAEDVRPPYCGTFTKIQDLKKSSKLRRAPFSRVREDTDYDYDSEAEWEEPEEGEDILSDGEDDAESVDSADEMDGFLDDAEAPDAVKTRRNMVTNDIPPISTGICWENASGKIPPYEDHAAFDLQSMRLDWLLDVPTGSVDPFSDSYWKTETATSNASALQTDGKMTLKWNNNEMKPPRAPLQPRNNSGNSTVIVGAASGEKGPIMAVASTKTVKAAVPKLRGADMAQFKEAVDGSNLTQAELLKALKQRFPRWTNQTIKETLLAHCARLGASVAEKRWRFVSD
ncbi:hypothetical protein MBLNU457_g0968t1 [Dothideomycetes sp. NU457]